MVRRWARAWGKLARDEETGDPFTVPCCPSCHAQVVDRDGVPLTHGEMSKRRKRTCEECGTALWQADATGPRRYPLADYVKHRMKGFFDLLIGDEVHEYKGRGSAQGIAAGVLADACGKSLTLTGHTPWRLLIHPLPPPLPVFAGDQDRVREVGGAAAGSPATAFWSTPSTTGTTAWTRTVALLPSARSYRKTVRERPGLAPSALFHLIGNSVFLRLADVASGLPPYEEQVMLSGMDSETDHTGLSQRSAHNHVFEKLQGGIGRCPIQGFQEVAGHLPPDAAGLPRRLHQRGDGLRSQDTGPAGAGASTWTRTGSTPRRRHWWNWSRRRGNRVGRVLVYATHTGTRDITKRMDDILTRHGFRVAVMKADAVPPERREAWVADKVKEGMDVLICHPRLVQTGLDLVDFPTIVWFETDYSVYVMRQASRRSWRIGQTRPVKVVFMAYRNTLQADALKLVAKKLQSSLAVEGELPEDGLAAYGDDGDDLMLALARKIVNGDTDDAESVEAVFAQARDAEATAEELPGG